MLNLAPEAEGHGTDGAIAAYHHKQGNIRLIVPIVKIFASAITLGTGGSGARDRSPKSARASGRLSAGCFDCAPPSGASSWLPAWAQASRRFFARRSPDFESEVIIPAGLASVIAYCTFGLGFGWAPLFALPPEINRVLSFDNPLSLLSYTLLAIFLVVLAMIYTRSFYSFTYLLRSMKLQPHFRPAIGAFLSGLLGLGLYYAFNQDLQVLSVLSFGYGIIETAMTAQLEGDAALWLAQILLAVAVGKILTTGLTIGSGGSGGVFGPSMVIGGCGGGSLGVFLNWISPTLVPHPGNFVIVGMAGFFAAAAKTPFSTLVMVSEKTGNYNLLLPTLWVCAMTFLLSDELSIYSSQVESRSRSPAHKGDYVRDVLADLRISLFVAPGQVVPSLRPGDRLSEVIERLSQTAYNVLPVTDAEGRIFGLVSRKRSTSRRSRRICKPSSSPRI